MVFFDKDGNPVQAKSYVSVFQPGPDVAWMGLITLVNNTGGLSLNISINSTNPAFLMKIYNVTSPKIREVKYAERINYTTLRSCINNDDCMAEEKCINNTCKIWIEQFSNVTRTLIASGNPYPTHKYSYTCPLTNYEYCELWAQETGATPFPRTLVKTCKLGEVCEELYDAQYLTYYVYGVNYTCKINTITINVTGETVCNYDIGCKITDGDLFSKDQKVLVNKSYTASFTACSKNMTVMEMVDTACEHTTEPGKWLATCPNNTLERCIVEKVRKQYGIIDVLISWVPGRNETINCGGTGSYDIYVYRPVKKVYSIDENGALIEK